MSLCGRCGLGVDSDGDGNCGRCAHLSDEELYLMADARRVAEVSTSGGRPGTITLPDGSQLKSGQTAKVFRGEQAVLDGDFSGSSISVTQHPGYITIKLDKVKNAKT